MAAISGRVVTPATGKAIQVAAVVKVQILIVIFHAVAGLMGGPPQKDVVQDAQAVIIVIINKHAV